MNKTKIHLYNLIELLAIVLRLYEKSRNLIKIILFKKKKCNEIQCFNILFLHQFHLFKIYYHY